MHLALPSVFIPILLLAGNLYSQSTTDTRSDIQKLGIDYTETLGDVKASLTYYPHGQTHGLFFGATGPSNAIPSLETQCAALDKLLGRVLKEHNESEWDVLLGVTQEVLMEPLQRYLLKDAGWDAKRGVAREGRSSRFLVQAINKSGILDPIAKVFNAHGYTFCIRAMNRVDVEKIPKFNGARLPLYIWEMDFYAKKK